MGGGLIFEDAISLDYKLPPPKDFRIESTVRGHHVYKAAWSPYIGEELPVQREVNNIHDDFAVAVLKNGVRGVSDSPEGMTPQSLAPKDQLTPPWRK